MFAKKNLHLCSSENKASCRNSSRSTEAKRLKFMQSKTAEIYHLNSEMNFYKTRNPYINFSIRIITIADSLEPFSYDLLDNGMNLRIVKIVMNSI